MTKIYFPGLNGLRFFAAFAVVISHIELLKNILGFENAWENDFIFYLGGLGVYFFFVLSGFLITYLLLSEKSGTGTIGIKNFYIRRILRIWPLYYFLTFLGFFVFPEISFLELPFYSDKFKDGYFFKLISYIFIFPNLALSVYHPIPHIGQLWSIGVEEQFYLFWPVVMRHVKKVLKLLIYALAAIIILKTMLYFYAYFFRVHEFYIYLKRFVVMNKFECMAIGAIGACLVFDKHHFIAISHHKIIQIFALVSVPALMYITPVKILQDGIHILFSVSFLVIILNVSGNKNAIINLENNFFDTLGKISYGIYMYHMFIVALVVKTAAIVFNVKHEFGFFENSTVYFFSTALTILVSYVSYNLFEKKFIKLKLSFSKIVSGDMVKSS